MNDTQAATSHLIVLFFHAFGQVSLHIRRSVSSIRTRDKATGLSVLETVVNEQDDLEACSKLER